MSVMTDISATQEEVIFIVEKGVIRLSYSVHDTSAIKKKKIPSAPNRGRTYDLLINPSDALSLSYRRLVAGLAV